MFLHDQGLVLRRIPYGETSLVVRLFCRESGSVSFMARGVRKRKGLERAALAGFHTVAIQGRSRSGAGMINLTRAEIEQGRHRILGQPRATAAAQVIQEGLFRATPEGQANPELYDDSAAIFDLLDAGLEPLGLTALWMGRALASLGYAWRMDACAGCGGSTDPHFFSTRRGRMVCGGCGTPYEDRLHALTPAMAHAMSTLEWRGGFDVLSLPERGRIYRIGAALLAYFGGARLGAVQPCPRIAERAASIGEPVDGSGSGAPIPLAG